MPLVPAKCPECGGNINIESEQRLGVCEYCKQPFVVQEAINHFNTTYNITNNNEIKTDVVNIFEQSENKDTAINDIIAKVEIARKSGKIRYEEAKTELFEYLDKYASDIQLKKRSLGIVVSYAMEDLSKDILWWKDISQIAELVDAITLLGGVLSDDEKEMYDEFCRNVLDKLTQDYGPWDKICDNANNNADRSKRIFVLDFLSVMKTSACPKMLSEKYDDINNGVARGYFGHYYYTTYFTGGSDGWDEPCLGYVQECIQSREQLEDYLQKEEEVTAENKRKLKQDWDKRRMQCFSLKICPYCKKHLSITGKCKNGLVGGKAFCPNFGKKIFTKEGEYQPGIM